MNILIICIVIFILILGSGCAGLITGQSTEISRDKGPKV